MRRSKSATFLICLAGVLAAAALTGGCSKDNSDNGGTTPTIRHPEDFLPTNVSGWELSGEVKSGTTQSELRDAINGGYTTYWRHNMKEFAQANYLGTGSGGGSVDIRVYEFETTADAQALYNDTDLGYIAQENPSVGDMAGMFSAGGFATLWFTRDQYFTEIILSATDTQYAEQQVELLAAGIDTQMQEE